MGTVKTAITIPEDLFEQADEVARELKTSRSAVIATALAEYLGKRSARRLLAALDVAYGDEMVEEREVSRRMARQQRRALRDD